MTDCCCGMPEGTNCDNCERCQLLATIRDLRHELTQLRERYEALYEKHVELIDRPCVHHLAKQWASGVTADYSSQEQPK